jgi:hypothetical protein
VPSWNDQQRSDLVASYRRSGLTQDAFCAELRSEGIDLSPRTLRSWIARLEPPEGVVEECLQAVDVAMGELRRVEAMLIAVQPSDDQDPANLPRREVESAEPIETGLPDGTVLPPSHLVPPVSKPVDSKGSMPNGMPALAPPRQVGRIRWG